MPAVRAGGRRPPEDFGFFWLRHWRPAYWRWMRCKAPASPVLAWWFAARRPSICSAKTV